MMTVLEVAIVYIGAALLISAVYYTLKIIKENPKVSIRWFVVLTLLLLFFIGYFAFMIFISEIKQTLIGHITVAILCTGGFFVFLVINFSYKSIRQTREIVSLEIENQKIRDLQTRLENILDNSAESIITVNEFGIIENFNRASEILFGYHDKQLLNKPFSLLLANNEHTEQKNDKKGQFIEMLPLLVGGETEIVGKNSNRDKIPLSIKISSWEQQKKKFFTLVIADIHRRKELIEKLQSMAVHDGLTGLYNRSYLLSKISEISPRISRGTQQYALLYVDLDNFKYINDNMGHAAGDHLLINVATIINKRLRKIDYAARLGGDEFAIPKEPQDGLAIAEELRTAIAQNKFIFNSKLMAITASFGVVMLDDNNENPENSIIQADYACQIAKKQGRNQSYLLDPKQQTAISSDNSEGGWTKKIKYALAKNQLTLNSSSICKIEHDAIFAYDMYACILDQNQQELTPAAYMPAAERFYLANQIDKWLIKTVLTQIKEKPAAAKFFIPISMHSFNSRDFVELISTLIPKKYRNRFIFAIPENIALLDISTTEKVFNQLKEIGCYTSISEFSLNNTSIDYIRELPVDFIKLYTQLCEHIVTEEKISQTLLSAVNDVLHILHKKTILVLNCCSNKCFKVACKVHVDYIEKQ